MPSAGRYGRCDVKASTTSATVNMRLSRMIIPFEPTWVTAVEPFLMLQHHG